MSNTTLHRRLPFLRLTKPTAVLVLAIAIWSGSHAWPASAHASLVSSTPAIGETLTTAPTSVSITFDDALTEIEGQVVNEIQVFNANKKRVDVGTTLVDQATVTVQLSAISSGIYSVVYRVLSADGHPVSGEYQFRIALTPKPSAANVNAAPITSPSPSMPSAKPDASNSPTADVQIPETPLATATAEAFDTSAASTDSGDKATSDETAAPKEAAGLGSSWFWWLGGLGVIALLGWALRFAFSLKR